MLSETNKKLKTENENLNKKLEFLEQEITTMKTTPGSKPNLNPDSVKALESKLQLSVSKMVDEMLKNNSVNSSLIPDYIEKKLYTNVFTILIGIMTEMLEDVSINLLNQTITLKMSPSS